MLPNMVLSCLSCVKNPSCSLILCNLASESFHAPLFYIIFGVSLAIHGVELQGDGLQKGNGSMFPYLYDPVTSETLDVESCNPAQSFQYSKCSYSCCSRIRHETGSGFFEFLIILGSVSQVRHHTFKMPWRPQILKIEESDNGI